MKTKIILLFTTLLFVTLILPQGHAFCQGRWQVSDNCLRMELPNDLENGYYNPGLVMLDSCDGSPTFGKRYVKNELLIGFDEYIFFQKPVPSDTLVDFTAIDSITYINSYLRFKELYNILRIYKITRWVDSDSGNLYGKIFRFIVNEYFNYDSLKSFIDNIEHVNLFHFQHVPDSNVYVRVNDFEKSDFKIIIENNQINITLKNDKNFNEFNICIYDILGNKIYEEKINNSNPINIDISNYRYGVYFLRINDKVYKFMKI